MAARAQDRTTRAQDRTNSLAGSLTYDLRGLVWGLESEVAQITSLCMRIDDHVHQLNALRQQAADQLLRLDELVDAAEDPHLRSWLETVTEAALPTVPELFPDRLYTD